MITRLLLASLERLRGIPEAADHAADLIGRILQVQEDAEGFLDLHPEHGQVRLPLEDCHDLTIGQTFHVSIDHRARALVTYVGPDANHDGFGRFDAMLDD